MANDGTRERGWEAATWEGSRREQLRRSLRLTVRERLEALEALAEAGARLAEVGKRAREESGPNLGSGVRREERDRKS